MFDRDFDDFTALLDGALSLNPNWKPIPSTGKALFFKALKMYPLEVVSTALTAHIRDPHRGRFQPTPADIVAQIESRTSNDGRLGVEEAWAMVRNACDEAETVVWTEEMRDAFAVCRPVLEHGDEVAARMSFKEAYIRLVDEARRSGRQIKWEISQGTDKGRRAIVLERAVTAGYLPAPQANLMLPAPIGGDKVSPIGLARIKAEVAKLIPGSVKAAKAREEAMRREADQKQNIAYRVNQYAAEHGI